MDGNLVYKGKKCRERIFEFQILASKKSIFVRKLQTGASRAKNKSIFWKPKFEIQKSAPNIFTFIYKVFIHAVLINIYYNLSEKQEFESKILWLEVSYFQRFIAQFYYIAQA